MKPVESVHERWNEIPVTSAPQVLACGYCVLLEWEHDNLAAPFWRWYWNDRKGASLLLPHERVPIEPERVVLIPPHTVFGTAFEGRAGHLYAHFALGLSRPVTPGQIFHHRPSTLERGLIRRLIGMAGKMDGTHNLEATFLAQTLINAALAAVPADYWKGWLTDRRIARALETIALDETAGGNAELARAAEMNPNAFIRKFVQATGHTPHQYRLRLRVERAATWLREGKLSIEQVAAAAGFCDRYHFSRVFRRVMGASPARYRRTSSSARSGGE